MFHIKLHLINNYVHENWNVVFAMIIDKNNNKYQYLQQNITFKITALRKYEETWIKEMLLNDAASKVIQK